MFEKAVRFKLRFNYKGICSVEDLWDMPVSALDNVFKKLNKEYKEQKEESLLKTKTKEDEILDLKIEIVKHIVATKVKEKEIRKNMYEEAEKRQKILGIIADKKDKELYDKPVEELEKLIA